MVDTKTIELFRRDEMVFTVQELIEKALAAIGALFAGGHPIIVAYSGGKDSSVVAALVLHAAVLAKAAGGNPLVIVTTGDTGVESPEAQSLYQAETAKMRRFAKDHGVRLVTKTVQPTLLSTWQLKILSGRGLPSFPGSQSDCSVDLKIHPQRMFRRKLFRKLAQEKLPEPVTCLGTRLDEGQRRATAMLVRGDRSDAPVRNKDGELILSPVRVWSTDDVWEAIAIYGGQQFPSFSDFEETKRVYAHSSGTSCAVVADAIYEGGEKRGKGGCGARLGCHVCQVAEDKSLANMIEYDARYAYAKGLNQLNRFIRNTRYDWQRRHWVGRTIKEGWVTIQPDTYHPSMIRALTRYMLQLDYDEELRAANAGERPKFRLLPLDVMIAVDAMQSLNGVAMPFSVWADHRDIRQRGVRYDVPDVPAVKQSPIPVARFLHVGKEWDSTAGNATWTGLRDPYFEALTERSGCAPELTTLRDGKLAWAVETEPTFSVDIESACFIEDFEVDRLLRMHDQGVMPGGVTTGYLWYLSYGCLSLSHAQQNEHDAICRRTAHKDRLGITCEYDIASLIGRSVGFADLPPEARVAWGGKATTASAQVDLLFN
ncbi:MULTISPECIES: phosphoadenosine phosphosulfate reductase family protein [Cupriavidus]|uniref:phosphoadenosine phosphosulfate reductase family protein n=1 Tax=Cupriavidus TaxID=106589 RepID=UPI0011ED45D9|nr:MULTISPECIES: phosphoadenosine phosphosulfate reductase family protein [Cupriavidus]MWL91811.1 phosphoadenosine phosphosulfate sulfotransferase [Cupriavidus sp. SW-Y-13]